MLGQRGGARPDMVFKAGSQIQKGEHAKLSSFIGAVAVADLIKSTLGPKGMDKMLISADPGMRGVVVTNDGATILKKIPVDNPAAKILVNMSMTQDDEIGDGTTSVVVLAGEFLREAEKLIEQRLHPQTIIAGWRKALRVATKTLESSATDNKSDPEKFRQDLLNIARTTLSSKIVVAELDFFAEMCVNAVMRLKGAIDLDMIQIVKKPGGSMRDSFLDDGFILDKSFGLGQRTCIENPKILIANTAMDTDKIKIFGARVKASSLEEIATIEAAEKLKMKNKVDKILKHDIDVFVNRQLIYDYPEELFSEAGVSTIEHADFDGVERLARVLDGEIMSVFDVPSASASGDEKTDDAALVEEAASRTPSGVIRPESKKTPIATCDKISTMMIGEDTVIKFSGVPRGEACSIVLRGASSHLLDEMERSLHDALCVLTATVNASEIVLGGGASEMMMAQAVEQIAKVTAGKEALAIDAFAAALRKIPIILSNNAGFDSADIVTKLRAAHAKGQTYMGVDMKTSDIGDMRARGVTESLKSKSQSLISAHEAAEMILRVDDVVKHAPRARG